MKHFFIELTACYIPKNKAHEAFQEFALTYHDTIADEQEKAKIKFEFAEKLNEINKEFSRCKDIELSGYFYDSETISVDGNFILAFKEVMRYRLVEPIPGPHYTKV